MLGERLLHGSTNTTSDGKGHHIAVSGDDARIGAALDRVTGNLINTLATSWLLTQGVGSTEATAMGAVAGPLGEEVSFALRKVAIKKITGMVRLLEGGAESQDVSTDDLLEAAVSDPSKLELLGRAMDAAARATSMNVIDTLARAFATGVLAEDCAAVDETFLVIDALGQIDAPHLRLLAILSQNAPHTDLREDIADELRYAWTVEQILVTDPGLSTVVDALIAKLRSLGVIRDDGQGRLDYKPYWCLTGFGHACHAALIKRGARPSGAAV
ncbi:MAG: hypothetical protein M3332_02995 [Actinomycetota bacterium]|nr:hypothetical protein [Actinomycetota bacterium]